MQLAVIDKLGDLEQIAKEWEELLRHIGDITPFQLPPWQLTWWKHFGSGLLRVLVFRENGRMVGIVPCFLHEWNNRRQLTLIGSGLSDYLEPAIEDQHAGVILEFLQRYLQSREEWDVCDWQDLNAGSRLAALRGDGFRVEEREGQPCSRIPLNGTYDEFWRGRGKDLRRNVRRYGLRAAEAGAVEFKVIEKPDAALLHSVIQLHTARWEAKGEPGMIAANHAAEFLCDVGLLFADRGMVRVFTIHFQGQTAALNLAFLFRNTVFAYMSAFDPQHEHFGFGRKLLHDAIKHCYESGVAYWNFMRGDEPYKFSWGAECVAKSRMFVEKVRLLQA